MTTYGCMCSYMFIYFIHTQVNIIFLLLSLRSLYMSRKNKVQFENSSQVNIVKYVSVYSYLLKCILKARFDLAGQTT